MKDNKNWLKCGLLQCMESSQGPRLSGKFQTRTWNSQFLTTLHSCCHCAQVLTYESIRFCLSPAEPAYPGLGKNTQRRRWVKNVLSPVREDSTLGPQHLTSLRTGCMLQDPLRASLVTVRVPCRSRQPDPSFETFPLLGSCKCKEDKNTVAL